MKVYSFENVEDFSRDGYTSSLNTSGLLFGYMKMTWDCHAPDVYFMLGTNEILTEYEILKNYGTITYESNTGAHGHGFVNLIDPILPLGGYRVDAKSFFWINTNENRNNNCGFIVPTDNSDIIIDGLFYGWVIDENNVLHIRKYFGQQNCINAILNNNLLEDVAYKTSNDDNILYIDKEDMCETIVRIRTHGMIPKRIKYGIARETGLISCPVETGFGNTDKIHNNIYSWKDRLWVGYAGILISELSENRIPHYMKISFEDKYVIGCHRIDNETLDMFMIKRYNGKFYEYQMEVHNSVFYSRDEKTADKLIRDLSHGIKRKVIQDLRWEKDNNERIELEKKAIEWAEKNGKTITITKADSIEAGNCELGTNVFADTYFPKRNIIQLEKLLPHINNADITRLIIHQYMKHNAA